MLGKVVTLLSMSFVILGWYGGDLDLKIRFDHIYGLKVGDRIIFEQNEIGSVTHVVYEKERSYLVDVEIHKNFRNAVTGRSRFFIVTDPSRPTSKAVEMIMAKGEGRPLADGAVVRGSTRFAAFLDKMEDDLSRNMETLTQTIKRFSEELKEIPEDEDIQRLKKDLDQLLDEMKRSGAAFREKVQKELLPRLQEEIEKLKEKLRTLGREKEVEPLQTKMDEMRKI
ncbi:MAG: hypothetical protein JRL30_17630 [Deltaproteobacteria bacterium]|nr:hypothetical protein [Deltaproteobacteria bacterium]